MSYSEFVHHIAFHSLFPWGEDWRQTEAIAATVMAASQKYRWFDVRRFFPKPKQPKPQSPEYMLEFFKGLAQAAAEKRKRTGVN